MKDRNWYIVFTLLQVWWSVNIKETESFIILLEQFWRPFCLTTPLKLFHVLLMKMKPEVHEDDFFRQTYWKIERTFEGVDVRIFHSKNENNGRKHLIGVFTFHCACLSGAGYFCFLHPYKQLSKQYIFYSLIIGCPFAKVWWGFGLFHLYSSSTRKWRTSFLGTWDISWARIGWPGSYIFSILFTFLIFLIWKHNYLIN